MNTCVAENGSAPQHASGATVCCSQSNADGRAQTHRATFATLVSTIAEPFRASSLPPFLPIRSVAAISAWMWGGAREG